jgi:hypothetical protein
MRTSWREPLVFASIKSPCVDVVRVYDESLASREGGGSHEGLWAERFLISLDELFLAMRTDPPGPVFGMGRMLQDMPTPGRQGGTSGRATTWIGIRCMPWRDSYPTPLSTRQNPCRITWSHRALDRPSIPTTQWLRRPWCRA